MRTAHRTAAHAKRKYQADPFAMFKVVARTTGFNQAEQTACALPVRIAWGALKGGTANENDIATLTDVIAICTVAGQNMDALVEETCDAARRAMCAVADRFIRCQRWGCGCCSTARYSAHRGLLRRAAAQCHWWTDGAVGGCCAFSQRADSGAGDGGALDFGREVTQK